MKFEVASFYKFAELSNETLLKLQADLLLVMESNNLFGTVLLASEGINGSVAGCSSLLKIMFERIFQESQLVGLDIKYTYFDSIPFSKKKVVIKNEIVTFKENIKIEDLIAQDNLVDPQNWNVVISNPEVMVIDVRNNYETQIGTFARATDPNTETFIEFKKYVEESLDVATQKKLAIFCTGGIRCEKAAPYLREKGFEVQQLKGGIINYIQKVEEEDSLWEGKCFVFDDRRAL